MIEKTIAKAAANKSELLNLSGLRMVEIPLSVLKIKSLKILNLRNNDIKDVTPLFGLPNLEVVYLSGNKIRSIHPEFFNSVNLKVLDLSNNYLENIPETLEHQINLRRLFLASNQLTMLPSSLFFLENLEILSVSSNRIKRIPKKINKLKRLTDLYANNNKITEVAIDFLKLDKLASLYLSSNLLTKLPNSVGKSKTLKRLNVYSNKLTTFPNLENAELSKCEIHLADNHLSEISLSNSKLQELHLYFSPLVRDQLTHLGNAEIKEIYIDHSQINNFRSGDEMPASIRIINNEEMEIRREIYKAIPSSIEEKFGLKSWRGIKLNKMSGSNPPLNPGGE